ncbi:MAG: hypothetical protein RIQ79_2567 [Verrucomicrobiota bacterium]|jgi:hypothetical protein
MSALSSAIVVAVFSGLILTPRVLAQGTAEAKSSPPPAAAVQGPAVASPATDAAPSPEQVQRAEKIAATLGLTDPDQTIRVRDLIARQYADLSVIHAARDAALKSAKEAGGESATQAARDNAASRQADLHYAFLARLAAELSPAQIDQVKDGLTYGVLPNTFKVYQEMLPQLTPEQKRQIFTWLTEAREHALDAGSSNDKHAWFGKYKGRINNYLSKAGIDMKQAEHEMFARKKESATK